MSTGANNFLTFDSAGTNMMSDTAYAANASKFNGMTNGVADPTVFNKAIHQATIMSAALAQFIANTGADVSDTDVATLITVLTAAIAPATSITNLAGTGRTTETVKANADAIIALSSALTSQSNSLASLSAVVVPNELLQDIKGTIQYPTIVNGQITEIDHKSGTTVIRSDVFTYATNLITEVRTIVATGATVTLKYHLDTLETEVI